MYLFSLFCSEDPWLTQMQQVARLGQHPQGPSVQALDGTLRESYLGSQKASKIKLGRKEGFTVRSETPLMP